MKRFRWLITGAAAGALGVLTYTRYLDEIKSAQRKVLAGGQIIETPLGSVEYVCSGEGPPVLIVHGGGGGYDQGLHIARVLGGGFRWIAMSRFGYLRTPVLGDGSPEAQADAYAALLDVLDIPKAAIIGVSAGGPSSIQFALRHPNRCTALVLVSAITQRFSMQGNLHLGAFRWAFKQEFITWLSIKIASPIFLTAAGIPLSHQRRLTRKDFEAIESFKSTLVPISPRAEGLLTDIQQALALERYPLENIIVPTLVLHAADDPVVKLAHADFSSNTIPGAERVIFPSGGHLLLGHLDKFRAEVRGFLTEKMPGG